MKIKLLISLFISFCFFTVQAQSELLIIKKDLESNQSKNNLNKTDFADLEISSSHFSKSTNVKHVYVQQKHSGVPIYNAIGSFAIKDGVVKYSEYDFASDLNSKVLNQNPSLSPQKALTVASSSLGFNKPTQISILKSTSRNEVLLSKSGISIDDIPVKLVYYKSKTGSLNLAWDMSINLIDGSHWWSIRVDAQNGRILDKNDWIVNCNFNHSSLEHRHLNVSKHSEALPQQNSSLIAGSVYNVFPYPVESPNHGPRQLITNPEDSKFSPFGWHDTDGVEGAEYTITRGNNVYAYEDGSDNNFPGYSPDGGAGLNFDFALDFNQPPQINEDAAITNLFYWNNITHDLWANYGFDEASGNFQQTNYTGEGLANDYVRAEALDGSGLNNANFGTPPDGFRPRMQMYLWSAPGPPEEPLSIKSPVALAGDYDGIPASFGPTLPLEEIPAELVLAVDLDSTTDELDACDNLINFGELDQKIVVIRRGSCNFTVKIKRAQDAGAIAVIMVNNVPGVPITMGGDGADITIPSIMVSQSIGEPIIEALLNKKTVLGALINNGPYRIDGDFDNGIIAHEYAHGISTRLTGGASAADCLGNEEQMGEGWSDWVGLMMTISENDIATQGRGIGTFATAQPIEGVGIRPYRYSTDTNINPATYALTNNPNLSEPHGIGFVWATMLWDLNWALIERYGFDSDLYSGTGGNNMNMQLVIDGMKLQPCEPGFVDGRDAILEADRLNNDGANQCLIWDVFAKRGLGWSAKQGDTDNRLDQVEAFDMPPNLNCSLSNESYEQNGFGIFPNPAKESFRIKMTNENLANTNVDIYDMNGKLVLSKTSDINHKVNIQKLVSGMYIVVVKSENKTFTKKLIVE